MSKTLSDISLPITGMSCASCVSHVEGALKELPGVSNVVVNLATNTAHWRRFELPSERRTSHRC